MIKHKVLQACVGALAKHSGSPSPRAHCRKVSRMDVAPDHDPTKAPITTTIFPPVPAIVASYTATTPAALLVPPPLPAPDTRLVRFGEVQLQQQLVQGTHETALPAQVPVLFTARDGRVPTLTPVRAAQAAANDAARNGEQEKSQAIMAEAPNTTSIPIEDIDVSGELRRLNRAVLDEYIELVRELGMGTNDAPPTSTPPPAPARVARLQHLWANMAHLLNLCRPHQARQTVMTALAQQVERRNQQTKELNETTRVVKALLAQQGGGATVAVDPEPIPASPQEAHTEMWPSFEAVDALP